MAVLTSTPTAPPATSPLFAPPSPDRPELVAPTEVQGAAGAFALAPPSKPETKPERTARLKAEAKAKASAVNAEAWATCCQHWQTISGKMPALSPGEGAGLSLMEAIERDTAAVVVRRFAYLASGAGDWMRDRGAKITAVCRTAKSEWVKQTDREALDWERAQIGEKRASDKPGTDSRVVVGVERQNAPQASQAVSWPDVLRDLGSDPQHHPDDGPHREAWQRVRQAVLVSIRKPGDPWLVFCNADDRARQNVERLLVGGLVK